MKKSLLSVMVFFFGIGISISFQNCGESTLQANSSGKGGLQVDVINDETSNGDGDGDSDIAPGNGEFGFNLNNGDNIFFVKGGGLSLNLATSRLSAKLYDSYLETHVYEQRGTTFVRDLPTGYCNNSALPHCAHTTTAPCVGLGCFKGPSPVRCHWQKRMSTVEENDMIAGLNALQFLNREVLATDPMISDCNTPILHFYKTGDELQISLADPACVADNQYYAADDSGNLIESIFSGEIDEVTALTDNSGASPEYCNNYNTYAWDTTKFSYRSVSGLTNSALDSFRFEADYEAKIVMDKGKEVLAGFVNLVFKETGSDVVFCANAVNVQPAEIAILFPNDGLTYEVIRTESAISDAPTAEITYEDVIDGGSVWRLFLDRASALTNSGGATVDSAQAAAIKSVVQSVLVNRAKVNRLAVPCSDTP